VQSHNPYTPPGAVVSGVGVIRKALPLLTVLLLVVVGILYKAPSAPGTSFSHVIGHYIGMALLIAPLSLLMYYACFSPKARLYYATTARS